MKNIKVILSTFGPLHLIKSAEFLEQLVDIRVIQGWIPKWYDRFLIKIASKIVGRDLSKSFQKRTPSCLNGKNISCGLPEFYLWFLKCRKSKDASFKGALFFGKKTKKYIKEADIFHVRSGSGRGGAIEKAKAQNMKIVVDHSIAHPAFMDRSLRSEYAKYGITFDFGLDNPFWQEVLKDCHEADCLLVNSSFVKNTFVEQGFDPNKIQVVYLGVRKDFFGLKKNWEINCSIKILFTGSFGFRKGGEYLLNAMQKLNSINVDYEMTIVGSYETFPIMKEMDLSHIHFIGHIPQNELKSYLASADIYLFPSLCEGCASSGMEAMAAGLPVIATLESGLPIENGIDGIIIPSKDEAAIIDAIIQLSQDTSLRKNIGKNAIHKMNNMYTWEKYAIEVTNIYRQLLTDEK